VGKDYEHITISQHDEMAEGANATLANNEQHLRKKRDATTFCYNLEVGIARSCDHFLSQHVSKDVNEYKWFRNNAICGKPPSW